jgi:hypothetical protein
MNSTLKSLLIWLGIIVLIVAIWQFAAAFQSPAKEIPLTEFIAKAQSGEIQDVTFNGNQISGGPKNPPGQTLPPTFVTYAPAAPYYQNLVSDLAGKNTGNGTGVTIHAKPEGASPWTTILLNWAPILLMVGFWIFIMRQMQSGGNKALSFGKSRAKLSSSTQKKVTFKDVAGADEAKEASRRSSSGSAAAFRRACSSWGRPARARRCSPAQSPAKPTCRSSRSADRISSRCSSASAHRACATSSNRARRTRRASSSSTKSTRSAAIAARALAAGMTSASRRSTNSSSRWTASSRTKA